MNTTLVVKKARTENKSTAKCFTCGAEISFKNKDGKTEYVKNRFGKSVVKRFNLDGSFHVCEKRQEKAQENKQEQSSQQQEQNKTDNIEDMNEITHTGHGTGDLVQVNTINQITRDTAMTIISKEGKEQKNSVRNGENNIVTNKHRPV